jgi:hypothetical protein
MRKQSTKTKNVLAYLEKNPKAKPAEVAKKFKMAVQYVYKLRSEIKLDKELTMSKPSAMWLVKRSSVAEVKDNVNHPAHYKTGGIETIDYIEAKSLNYNLGNVVKYVSRSDYKGKKIEDLKKAQWYLAREITNLEKA